MSFGGWWRLTLGTAAFVMFAPGALPLFLLPLAALIVAAGARSWAGWVIVGIAATAGLWLAVPRSPATLEAAIGAYMLLASVGFVATALCAPDRFLRQALRATLAGTAGAMLLCLIQHGGLSLGELQWDAVRQTSNMARIALIEVPTAWGFKVSDFAPAFEPVVRFLSVTWPAQLVLATVAGFALAWQWHVRVARDPPGPPLGPFRQFRFGDHWVWALVAALLVYVIPKLAELRGAALNVGVVLGALYFLRGGALVVVSVILGVLVIPLLFIVPGVWTLGVFDTWLAFRQRIQSPGRPTAS